MTYILSTADDNVFHCSSASMQSSIRGRGELTPVFDIHKPVSVDASYIAGVEPSFAIYRFARCSYSQHITD